MYLLGLHCLNPNLNLNLPQSSRVRHTFAVVVVAVLEIVTGLWLRFSCSSSCVPHQGAGAGGRVGDVVVFGVKIYGL